jgi:CelD/BcsL family acetyltransferase involved in cellulose biosynthesis
MVEIREHRDLNDPALAADWDEFDATSGVGSLFTTRLWIESWTDHFGDLLSAAFLVGHEAGRPVGLAPLFATPARELVLPVNFLSPRGEFMVGKDDARGFVRALLSHTRGARSPLRLHGVPVGSPTLAAIEREARDAGYLIHVRPARVSPFIIIEGSWDDYYGGKSRKVTHEWERKIRKLESAGDVRVLRFERGMDVRKLTDDFIAVEERSWKKRAGTSISARGVTAFYHGLSAALATKGSFDPFWLEFDGRVVAFLYGAVHDGTYYAMKTSYDEESSRWSPGVRLFHEAVRHAFGAGLARFDFLGERAPWKDQWANGWLEHVNVRLYPDTMSGRVAHLIDSRVKPLARRALRAGEMPR